MECFYYGWNSQGIGQVGSELRSISEEIMSKRAPDEYPGDIRTPTQDK
jgi:hypothetical protein